MVGKGNVLRVNMASGGIIKKIANGGIDWKEKKSCEIQNLKLKTVAFDAEYFGYLFCL